MSPYLDLLAKCVTGILWEDPPIDPWHGRLFNAAGERVAPHEWDGVSLLTIEPGAFDLTVREVGGDWPSVAETMIGLRRIENLRTLITDLAVRGIPGDLMEAGVWRGGACIFMRAVLHELKDTSRRVIAADSFEGLPPGERGEDKGDCHHTFTPLQVSLEAVKANFRRYGLLDEQVVFLKGFFKDTMPTAPIEKLALLRLDGDMYGSTMDVLEGVYDKLAVGGYCIVDDYNLPAVQKAISVFLRSRGEDPMAKQIDGHGVYWRKGPTNG